ncbi:MAG: cupin domain-containing protein [Prolixibacteraceae bacterium]|nr:cupin domain-containing protein [Burkholderiales bacterium]
MRKNSNLDPVIADDILIALVQAVKPAKISTSRINKVHARLFARIDEEKKTGGDGIRTSRLDEGWTAFADLAEKKVLFDDGKTESWLLRMYSGCRLPGHDHPGHEECLLLEGCVFLGNVKMAPGDYQVAAPGTIHGEVYSPSGCLLMVRSPSPAAGLHH